MEDKNLTFPKMNLQFFAEPASEPTQDPEPTPEPTPTPTPEPELSAEEQLQQMRVEMAKMKKSFDKASSEAADYKKKYNATLTEAEQKKIDEAEKQAERDEQFENLLKENTVTKLEKNFLALGYPQELATKAANAQYDNDTDALFKIQSDFQSVLKKNMEAEWLKNRPVPMVGAGEEKTTVTKEQFFRMGYSQRVEFKQKYPETYKSYTGK